MKRKLIILIPFLILSLFSGCSESNEINQLKSMKFYYCNTDIAYGEPDGVLSAESRDYIGSMNSIEDIMTEYLKGPSSDEHYSPFPKGTALTELILGDDTLYIALNKAFSELSGMDLTLACACITRTFLEITDVESVVIDVTGGIYGKNITVTFDKDSLIIFDNSLYADN